MRNLIIGQKPAITFDDYSGATKDLLDDVIDGMEQDQKDCVMKLLDNVYKEGFRDGLNLAEWCNV